MKLESGEGEIKILLKDREVLRDSLEKQKLSLKEKAKSKPITRQMSTKNSDIMIASEYIDPISQKFVMNRSNNTSSS